MPLTPNVVAATPIQASWGNAIRDRTLQRFTSYAELTSSWTSPAEGSFAFLLDVNAFLIYSGTAWVQLTPKTTVVAATESRANTAFGALTTAGPAVTIQTGTAALVTLTAQIACPGTTQIGVMGFAVSGASTIAATDANAVKFSAGIANQQAQLSAAFLVSGLTAGSNTFTAQYRSSDGNTVSFANRGLIVAGVT